MRDSLKQTIEAYLEVCSSPHNLERKRFWQAENPKTRDRFRPIPAENSKNGGLVPFIADPGPTMWWRLYGIDMKGYYTDAETYLEGYMKGMLTFNEWGDDTMFETDIPIFPGVPFESSMYGMKPMYAEGIDPWVGHDFVIQDPSDLDKLTIPDFRTSGLMPVAIKMYEEAGEILGQYGMRPIFPELLRSPYGVAIQIRGFSNLVYDMVDDPEFVHRLMRFLTDAHNQWYEDRRRLFGIPIPKAELFNDEVDNNLIGTEIYKEFILPYEQDVAKFHGGVAYWHSCGNITRSFPDILTMPVDMLNVSSWTDLETVARAVPDMPLEICLRAVDDVYLSTVEQMEAKVKHIMGICEKYGVKSYLIRGGSLNPFSEVIENDVKKITEWTSLMRRITR